MLGLYFNVLNEMFETYDYDEHYGALSAINPPMFNFVFMIIIFPIFVCMKSRGADKKTIKKFNDKAYIILFAPVALCITIVFTAINLILVPVAYTINVCRLISQVCDFDKIKDIKANCCTLLQFFFFGFFVLMISVPINFVQIFYNLYASDSNYVHPCYKMNYQISYEAIKIYKKCV